MRLNSRRLLWFSYLLVLVVPFQNCGVIRTPSAEGSLSSTAAFDHTGITSCASCHQTGAPFAAFPAKHQDIGTQDCSACHNPSAWLTSSTNPHGPNLPVPNQCASCHESQRPSGLQGTGSLTNNLTPVGGFFDHSGNGGTGDCATCHLAVPANAGVTFAGAVFGHSPTPTQCAPCHTSAQRPVGPVGSPSFDHASGGTGDCAGCHGTNVANIGRTWQQAGFNHSPVPTTCVACHSGDAAYTAIQNTIKNQMNHSSVTALPDCAVCHSGPVAASGFTSWAAEAIANGTKTALTARGIFHGHISTQPSTCQACHTNERPVGSVGSPVAFDHANGGTGDCVSCHAGTAANIGVKWSGGAFSHTGQTSCASCHASEKPAGTVPNTSDGFNHASTFGTECYSCHTVVTANIGVSWKNGFFNHNNNNAGSFSNCSPCHDTKRHNAGTNCANCHTITWPRANSNGSYGGAFSGG